MTFATNTDATLGPTVKQRIMAALETSLSSMQENGGDMWQEVLHGDLDDLENVHFQSVSIDFGIEEMLNNTFPCSSYRLPVFIHFKYRGQVGLDEHDKYLYYLGLLQLAVLGDHNLGGVSYDVKEVSNAHTIIGVDDAMPGGTLVVDVLYKTRLHNPYKLPHEA